MRLDRVHRQKELASDLALGEIGGEQPQDGQLGGGRWLDGLRGAGAGVLELMLHLVCQTHEPGDVRDRVELFACCFELRFRECESAAGDAGLGQDEKRVGMEFAYDGGGLAKGGAVTLYVDGDQVGEGRVEGTVPMIFSGDETTDVGSDTASPVSDDYGPGDNAFNGRVLWVQIDLGEDAADADHLITPEERLRVAMARQ